MGLITPKKETTETVDDCEKQEINKDAAARKQSTMTKKRRSQNHPLMLPNPQPSADAIIFHKVPLELRLSIYHFIFNPPDEMNLFLFDKRGTSGSHFAWNVKNYLALRYTCKQMALEVALELNHHTAFTFHMDAGMPTQHRLRNSIMFKHIRNLRVNLWISDDRLGRLRWGKETRVQHKHGVVRVVRRSVSAMAIALENCKLQTLTIFDGLERLAEQEAGQIVGILRSVAEKQGCVVHVERDKQFEEGDRTHGTRVSKMVW